MVLPELRFDRTYLGLLLAVLGATLPPYVFLWQNTHRLEELRDEPEGGDRPLPLGYRPPEQVREKKRTSALDIVCGMGFAVLVMFAVMVSMAVSIGEDTRRPIATAAEAATALEPVAGELAQVLFATGFVAAGILAIPVIAGSGSAGVSGLLGRDWGFSRSVKQAPLFYGLVVAGTGAGTLLGLLGISPIRLLVTAATVNGATSAPLLAVVMLVSGNRQLLGPHRAGKVTRAAGWVAVVVMGIAAVSVAASAV